MRFEKESLDFTVHKDMPWNNIKKQYFKHLSKFIGGDVKTTFVQVVGDKKYPLYQHLAKEVGVAIVDKSVNVWAFDCIESYINPDDFFCRSFNNGNESIIITCPSRSFVPMWSHNHFHEYDPERFEKLVNYYAYHIVRQESHIVWKNWYSYIGFRGIVRLLFPHRLHIYEIRK
jgi:hypothetical protein